MSAGDRVSEGGRVSASEGGTAPRTTRAQAAVLSALQGVEGFLSAQDLHARLRAGGSAVGLTSVYRAVQALAGSGTVDEHRSAGGEVGYRLCATTRHHHHLSCTGCGTTVELEAPETEVWVQTVGARHGYVVHGHVLELSGTCRACTPQVASGQ